MENGKMNKVTKTTKEEAKTTSRGEKCLAKFTAANGNVYGSLTLDIRKSGRLFATASSSGACVSWRTKDFPAFRKIIHYGRMVGSLRL